MLSKCRRRFNGVNPINRECRISDKTTIRKVTMLISREVLRISLPTLLSESDERLRMKAGRDRRTPAFGGVRHRDRHGGVCWFTMSSCAYRDILKTSSDLLVRIGPRARFWFLGHYCRHVGWKVWNGALVNGQSKVHGSKPLLSSWEDNEYDWEASPLTLGTEDSLAPRVQ